MCEKEVENEPPNFNPTETFLVGKQTLALLNYPVDTTVLETGVDKSKSPPEKYVTKDNYDKFVSFKFLPFRDWITNISSQPDNLEVLIHRYDCFTIEQLHSALNIFNLNELSSHTHKSIEYFRSLPFFWSDLRFNELLNDYLYALISKKDVKCLSSMPLRRLMKSSMDSVSHQLLYQQIRTDFIAYIMGVSNPLYFLSVIFGNLSLTTFNHPLPQFGSDFLRCARTISLPPDIGSYTNLSDMVKSDQLEYDPMFETFNFLIIENPEILAARNYPGGKGLAHEIWKRGLHPFTTNKQIDFFGEPYTLQSVIIYVGGGHYITLSNIGNFNDGRVEPGTQALNEFCENSKYDGNPGYLWFYQKTSYDTSSLKSRMVEPVRSNQEILCSSASRSTSYSGTTQFSHVDPIRSSATKSGAQGAPSSKPGEVHPLYLGIYHGKEEKFKGKSFKDFILGSDTCKSFRSSIDFSKDPDSINVSKELDCKAEDKDLFKQLIIYMKKSKDRHHKKYLKYKQKYLKLKKMKYLNI